MRWIDNKPIRLRDFIRVGEYYFSVIGYRKDEGVKCFLRYVPDANGDREKDGIRFRKLLHREAVNYAIDNKMHYFNGRIFIVPHDDIDEVFKPEERLKPEGEVSKIVNFFRSIPVQEMGVTGSRLIGLESEESDIDFVMYGKWWFQGRKLIKKGISRGELSEPDADTWNFIFRKRKVNIPYDIFLAHERRKYHRAVIDTTYFDLLYARGYDELRSDVPEEQGTRIGIMELRGEILDDSLIFDYPAYYPVKSEEIEAVLCFTHTYAGQCFRGEKIEARGVVESINGKRYLIVGTEREVKDEYIVSLNFLEDSNLLGEFKEWKRK